MTLEVTSFYCLTSGYVDTLELDDIGKTFIMSNLVSCIFFLKKSNFINYDRKLNSNNET